MYADIVRNGIYLTGGGALLRGLSKRFSDRIGIAFHVAEDPLHAVAKGTGIALKNIESLTSWWDKREVISEQIANHNYFNIDNYRECIT